VGPLFPPSLWLITQTRATYGGLCGMPACGQAVGCGVCDTRRSSGVAPRAFVHVYARVLVLVPPNLYIHTYTYRYRYIIILLYIYIVPKNTHINTHSYNNNIITITITTSTSKR